MRLNELNFDNTKQWPFAIKFGFLLGFSIIIIVLGYCLFIKYTLHSYTNLRLQEEHLKSKLKTNALNMLHLAIYKSRLKQVNDHWSDLIKKFPVQNIMSAVLDDMSRAVKDCGLTFFCINPEKESNHDFLVELPIKISLRGSYSQLLQFLIAVSKMTRIISFHEFKMGLVSTTSRKNRLEEQLELTLRAKTYRYQGG